VYVVIDRQCLVCGMLGCECAQLTASYVHVQLDAESREVYKQEQRRVKQQQKLAEEERQRMKDFDDYLVLAKYNP
jgi:predicted RNA methylase